MSRLRKALVILGLAVGLAAVAVILWRQTLVEAAARRVLAANGLDQARLEVVEVGPRAVVIEDLALGPDLPEARRLSLTYEPAALLSGRLRTLRIEGLRYAPPAGRSGDPATFDLPSIGTGGGGWFTLSRIEIENGLLTLAAPAAGTVLLDGAFDLSGGETGALLEVAADFGPVTGAFTLRSDALGEGGAVEIDGEGGVDLAGLVLPVAAGGAITAGRARYTVKGAVRIPALDAGLDGLDAERVIDLAGLIELSGVTSALAQGALDGELGWTLDAGGGMARLELPRPGGLSMTGIAPRTLAALGVETSGTPRDLHVELAAGPLVEWTWRAEGGAMEVAADLALSLGAARAAARGTARLAHDAAFRLSRDVTASADIEASDLPFALANLSGFLRNAAWSVAASLGPDGRLALDGPLTAGLRDVRAPGVEIAALDADGPLHISGRADRWAIDAPGLAVVAEEAAVPGRLALVGPLALAVESLGLELDAGTARLDLQARAEPVSGAVLDGDEAILDFTEAAGGVAISAVLGTRTEGELTLAEAGVTLPGYDVSLAGLSGRFPLGDGKGQLGLAARLRDTGRTARFPPFDLTFEGQRDGRTVTFSGTAAAPGTGVRLPLEGSVDLVEASGRMAVGPTPLVFRRGGLQPVALTSLLPPLADVAGTVRLAADVTFNAERGLASSASLGLEDVSLRSGEIAVAGLSGRLGLARLVPLATAGVQELSARSVIAGVPLEGGRARFTAEERGRGVVVDIREATGRLAGGTVFVEDARWDTAAASNAFRVRVRDVELSRLLTDWHIEGISGTGRLSGVIPVRVAPSGFAVDDGQLDAAGPGVIRVDWGSARETLVNSGEQVALTVRALEDFRYDSLSIGVDQPPDGELTLAVGLEGANPDVLDGHPFRFNVNLSGELGPILEAVREGQRIGTELLRGGLGAK